MAIKNLSKNVIKLLRKFYVAFSVLTKNKQLPRKKNTVTSTSGQNKTQYQVFTLKMPVFNAHFFTTFTSISRKIFMYAKRTSSEAPCMNLSIFGFIELPIKPGLKMPVFLICFKTSIEVNALSNKQSQKIVQTTWNIDIIKIEIISVKTKIGCYLIFQAY